TAERFIPNPFSNEPDSYLYKTGDLVRYLPDGNITFIGRIDNQVKIRGFRIELGEIETIINTHPQVNQAVVIASEGINSDKRLVAYVVTKNESLTTKQLREFLFSKLPEYMVPAAFITLETIPLTPNGKVDRKALPIPDKSSIQLENNFVLPSNPTEEILATIWENVLSIEKVGIHDNFFELGGHSLLATQVISRARQAFSVEITLQSLFEKPTIAGLSERIQTLIWLKESQSENIKVNDNEMEEIEL
ncbi:MAG: phosphopantetheine-binding protein, partial [Cyanobacteria bacterium J06649_11]